MMGNHAAHCFSNRGLPLQSFQIILYPEEIRTKHYSKRGVGHLGDRHVLPHIVEKRTEVLEEVKVDGWEGFTVSPDLVHQV